MSAERVTPSDAPTVWHDEVDRYVRTGRLDEGPCWCDTCIDAVLAALQKEEK